MDELARVTRELRELKQDTKTMMSMLIKLVPQASTVRWIETAEWQNKYGKTARQWETLLINSPELFRRKPTKETGPKNQKPRWQIDNAAYIATIS